LASDDAAVVFFIAIQRNDAPWLGTQKGLGSMCSVKLL